MAKTNAIRLTWAGGTHLFAIDAPRVPEGQGELFAAVLRVLRSGKPPRIPAPLPAPAADILTRLTTNAFGHADVLDTVRCGLIGGKNFAALGHEGEWRKAADLVREHVISKSLMESVTLAQMILFATIYGVDEEIAGKGLEPFNIPMNAFAEVPDDG